MPKPQQGPSLPVFPDPTRRRVLQAGASALMLPLLTACGSSDTASSAAACVPTSPAAAAKPPRGLHVSWTADPHTTRTVTWFTDGNDDPGSVIEYGPVANGMSACEIEQAPFPHRAEGKAHATYGVEALTHIATATGIDDALPLRYRIGSEQGWSQVRILPAASREAFRFCHFGDHAQSDASRAVLAGVQKRAPDFLWIAGDLSYANGNQPLWDSYFDMLDPVASRLPVMACPGNHEYKDGNGDGYRTRFAQPGKGTYYGFDYNNVHFCVSTGGSLLGGLAEAPDLLVELAALERDLADAARRRANGEIDFIIFVQHYTVWTNNEGREPANVSLVLLEEGMLLRHGVDLLVVGHDHIYERSKPMGRGRPREGGYVQITQGGGGQSLYRLIDDLAEWSAFATVRHGFTEYIVDGKTIRGTTYAVDSAQNELLPNGELEIIDTFEISARGTEARAGFLNQAKSLESLDVDLDAMIRHTIERNHLHDMVEVGGLD